ncbi:MAG TPA: glutamyl-tRNA reductase, partial [Thermomicrobiaceae bacterium]|nr:glutamyl-tRNA reductase [Thermomicrobiaceae bacterium]
MELFLLGVSHHSAPLAVRERLAFGPAERDALLAELAPEVPEAAAIVTCNRTELYGLGAPEPALAALARHAGLTPNGLAPHVTRAGGEAAVGHLFRVAAGLDSLVLGEPQILGQVRAAADAARDAGRGGPVLERLFNRAIVAGKRARSETPISQGAGSVSHAAVMLAREALGTLAGRHGLVIGLGEMGLVVARNLAAYGVRDLTLCNRTEARAAAVAPLIGARVVPWAGLRAALAEADVAIA